MVKNVEKTEPTGELVMRSVPMPSDANPNGDIFGGWLMSFMDTGASVIAKQIARRRVTTIAVDAMTLLHPVNVGDIVTCYAEYDKIGKTSVSINVEVWAKGSEYNSKDIWVTEGKFTFVAIDDNGRPVPIKATV